MRAGGVCDPGESEWEAKAWKTVVISQNVWLNHGTNIAGLRWMEKIGAMCDTAADHHS